MLGMMEMMMFCEKWTRLSLESEMGVSERRKVQADLRDDSFDYFLWRMKSRVRYHFNITIFQSINTSVKWSNVQI